MRTVTRAMSLIAFKVTVGRRRSMAAFVGVFWFALTALSFDPTAATDAPTVIPVVSLDICVVSWLAYACTRACDHGVRPRDTLLCALMILILMWVLVVGGAPTFGVTACILGLAQTAVATASTRARLRTAASAVAIAAGSLMVADATVLSSPGGHLAFSDGPTRTLVLVSSYASAPVFACLSWCLAVPASPTHLMAHGSTLAVIISTTVGFMSRLTSIDDHSSLAQFDFYATCYILVWSIMVACLLQLMLAFHVMRRTFDLYFLLASVAATIPIVQIGVVHKAVTAVQWSGVALILVASLLFAWPQTSSVSVPDELVDQPFFRCAQCDKCEDDITVDDINPV
jgi:hypothetical protein